MHFSFSNKICAPYLNVFSPSFTLSLGSHGENKYFPSNDRVEQKNGREYICGRALASYERRKKRAKTLKNINKCKTNERMEEKRSITLNLYEKTRVEDERKKNCTPI